MSTNTCDCATIKEVLKEFTLIIERVNIHTCDLVI